MTDIELGELQLIREWLRIGAGWVKDEEGRVLRIRPRPASWDTEEGAAKAIALWDILQTDPFPQPEGKPVRFDAGMSAPEVLGAEPEPKRRKKVEEATVPIEPFRREVRAQRREVARALESDEGPEMDPGQFDSLARSDPPPGVGRGP